jgi:hypothetical protein
MACSLAVVLIYGADALALASYPWDWSPDEGLTVDYARRVFENPGQLYPRGAVPFPLIYGPVLPVLLAPVVAHWPEPLIPARLVALAWTALGAAAVGALVRQRGTLLLAVASVALYLAPLDLTFWHLIVRPDGLMIALWLAAAVPLLPRQLERGSDRLTGGRLIAGSTLLLAAVLTKQTAVIHGFPLVVGWLLVDRASALKLSATMSATGLAALGLLQWTTAGGFLWVSQIFGAQASVPGQSLRLALLVLWRSGPLALLALTGAVFAMRSGGRPFRDSSVLLVVGGLLIAPAIGKDGASWNYLMPAFAASVVFCGRVWQHAGDAPFRLPAPTLGAVLAAVAAFAVATTRVFPLPNAEDERTSRAFYGFARACVSAVGGPILVSRPDYMYFTTGQPVEIEGSSFPPLLAHHVAGTEKVTARIRTQAYTLVAWTWPWVLPPETGLQQGIGRAYRYAGGCNLAWYFGRLNAHLFVRQDVAVRFVPPAGTRCRGGEG